MKLRLAFLALMLVGVAFLYWRSLEPIELTTEELSQLGVLQLPTPIPIQGLQLVDADGLPVSEERFRGRWTLAFFGFTNCPHICPMSMQELASAYRAQSNGDEENHPRFQGAFVSVDPVRDTPRAVKEFLQLIEPQFLGITGELPKIESFARMMGISFHIPEVAAPDGNYMVDHDQVFVVVDPEARCAGYIKPTFNRAKILRAFEAFTASEET